MNLRKLRRERKASTSAVDGTVKALPPGQTQPDARTIDVEPLTEPAAGRDEARAAFVRDTGGGDAPPADAPSSTSSPSDDAPSGDAPPQVTVDGVVTMLVSGLDSVATMFGPKLVGGERELWTQSEKEAESLTAAARPVVAKFMTTENITPEALLLGTLAFVYLPRALAGTMERAKQRRDARRPNHGAAHDVVDARPVVPPAPPASPASPASPAPQAEPAPAPKVAPVEEPSSASEFLRSIRGGK